MKTKQTQKALSPSKLATALIDSIKAPATTAAAVVAAGSAALVDVVEALNQQTQGQNVLTAEQSRYLTQVLSMALLRANRAERVGCRKGVFSISTARATRAPSERESLSDQLARVTKERDQALALVTSLRAQIAKLKGESPKSVKGSRVNPPATAATAATGTEG